MLAARAALSIGLLAHPAGLSAAADPCVDIDFVKSMAGIPAGTVLRTNANVMVYGLQAKQFPAVALPSGCIVGKRSLPGAFELKVTFMTPLEPLVDSKGDPLKVSSVVWDDMYVTSGKNRGMIILSNSKNT